MTFNKITSASMPEILTYLKTQMYGTCDFTVGGIFMWSEFFNYTYAISSDMLILKGQAETEMELTAFAMPIGEGDLQSALNEIQNYAKENKIPLEFSAVPEPALEVLKQYYDCKVTELCDWQDYVYLASDLKTLKGRKYNNRRNHVNFFNRNYADYSFNDITGKDIPRLIAFSEKFYKAHAHKGSLYEEEHAKAVQVLKEFEQLGLLGAYLEFNDEIIAFSIGEIINDTLFVHIEKALRDFRGSYEKINMEFARRFAADENIRYINREEDVGDPGLRAAKLSYHPVKMLKKYNVAVY